MTIYADYEYYMNEYKGSLIDEASFISCAREASMFVDGIINRPVYESEEQLYKKIQDAVCTLAEIKFNELKQDSGKVVASESVGPHSISYAVKTKEAKDVQKEMYAKALMILGKTGLLYRGVVGIG